MTYAESAPATRSHNQARVGFGLLLVFGLCMDAWLLIAAAISALF